MGGATGVSLVDLSWHGSLVALVRAFGRTKLAIAPCMCHFMQGFISLVDPVHVAFDPVISSAWALAHAGNAMSLSLRGSHMFV